MSIFTRPWETFARERIAEILRTSKTVLDIGGGLRIDPKRNNRLDPQNAWMLQVIMKHEVQYRILDYVDTYNPDIVGNIEDLPLGDNSEEAILCIAVLEHVENPIRATAELYRVLAPGGRCFVYVPFLYYYHAEEGYYGDYWRYTKDTLALLFKQFGTMEIQSVRGACETLVRLTPLGRSRIVANAAYLLDRLSGKIHSKQTSGYYVYLQK